VLVPSVSVLGATEGTSLAALEAMAVGVPVIASDLGGLSELLVGGCGVLFPAGDAGALAAALQEVLALEPPARRALVERARRRAREAHGLEAWIDAVLRAYAAAGEGGARGERVAPVP
jgi:glycosyltransferase involved in cell wall biosynthesis